VKRPINAKLGGRFQRFYIKDNFLNFWFRFIYRNMSEVEADNFQYVTRAFERDISSYSGLILERLFHVLIAKQVISLEVAGSEVIKTKLTLLG